MIHSRRSFLTESVWFEIYGSVELIREIFPKTLSLTPRQVTHIVFCLPKDYETAA